MKDDGIARLQGEVGFIQLGQGQMACPEDLLPRVLIRFADVDKDCSLIQETLGVEGAYFGKRHD
jgi:hypothetical protein